jgi:phage gp29-like protein
MAEKNEPTQPVAPASKYASRRLAPSPAIDRFPIIQGSQITLAYISSACRMALQGMRQQFVDVLSELLDQEPMGFAVLSKRVLAVAGARIEVTPAECDEEGDQKAAKEIALEFDRALRAIPQRTRAFGSLMWSLYSGIAAQEIDWESTADGWKIRGLRFVHSRRLAYPVYGVWDLHIWDQGTVLPWEDSPTQGTLGLRIDDYPGKFVVHSPQLRSEYPTREGLGRILVTYFAIKRLVMRGSAEWFERFFKQWVIAYYATAAANEGGEIGKKTRVAGDEDLEAGDAAMRSIGSGSMSAAMLPDSIRVEFLDAAQRLNQKEFLDYLDAAIAKAVLGQTHTTQPGEYGNRSAAETAKSDTTELARYDAVCFGDTLTDCLLAPWMALNHAGQEHLTPTLKVLVERPDPVQILDMATKAAASNVSVDGDWVAEQIGLQVTENKSEEPRRMAPLSPAAAPLFDLMAGEIKEPPPPPELGGGIGDEGDEGGPPKPDKTDKKDAPAVDADKQKASED